MADKLRLAPIPVPPGETLKEQLEIIGMKQKDLAIRLDMSDKHVNQIINGKAPLLPDTAIKLQSVLGIPSEFWLKLEMRYQNAIVQMKLLEISEEEKEIAKKIEYSQIASLGWVEPTRKIEEKVQNLKEYFRVADLSIIPRVAANFRKSTAFEASDYALAVWLRKGELIAQDIVVKQYSKSKLKKALPVLRSFTKREPDSFVDEMQALLAECGVAMALVPHLKHTHVNGATKWINREKVLLQVSLKGKYADVFWFTLFHEIGHILFEHSRKEILIDDDQTSNEKETQANEFASEILITKKKYNYWVTFTDLTAENILKFAEEIDIDPGIVVGRLQHDKYLKPYEHNELRRKFEISGGDMFKDIDRGLTILDRLRYHFEKKYTFFSLLSVFILFYIAFCLYPNITFSSMFKIGIESKQDVCKGTITLFISCFLLTICWFSHRKLKRFKKSEIGVVLGFVTENDDQKKLLQADFIDNLTKLLRRSENHNIKFQNLSQYKVNVFLKEISKNKNYYKKILNKTNAKLLLIGKFKKRENNKYIIEVEHISISHKEIPKNVSIEVSKEITERLPKKIIIDIQHEIEGFSISSNLYYYYISYLLGICHMLNYNLELSYDIHKYLYHELSRITFDTNDKYIDKFKSSVENKIIIQLVTIFRNAVFSENWEKADKYKEQIELIEIKSSSFYIILAIYHFKKNRDIDSSLVAIKKAENKNNYTWLYNKAFLQAYSEHLTEAYNSYKKATNKPTDIDAIQQCEIFIDDIIEKEPEKIQLHYCLGLLNYLGKEDYELAKEHFQTFINKVDETQMFLSHRKYVEKYIERINKKIAKLHAQQRTAV